MALYMDFSGTEGAIGYISDGEPVIPVGVSINAMPMSIKKKECELYQQFAKRNDVHFLFEDNIPTVDFYAVPWVDVAATDSNGGYIASVGESFSLSDSMPLIYISAKRECFLITRDSMQFLSIASVWKKHLMPYKDVTLYPSKEAAMEDFPIINVVDTPEYQELMKMVEENKGKTRSE
jgi:hypothetical protein